MDNRLKHALGDRPNSEFILNPEGVIIHKRAWSHPDQVRKKLEEFLGPVDPITRAADVHLKINLPPKTEAKRGIVSRITRHQMQPLVIEPEIDPQGPPFFAKLRAEAGAGLLKRGAGKLYLGFHLDPFHNAHWNNLTKPLSISIDADDGIQLATTNAQAPEVSAVSDCDPREFLIDVAAWPPDRKLQLTVTYYACVGETACHAVRQRYMVTRRRDTDGGGARGAGAGFWDADEFSDRLMAGDTDRDGLLTRDECSGLLHPHFDKLDINQDGGLTRDELREVTNWLNSYHRPDPRMNPKD